MKLVSRAQWGARGYRQPSGGITYSRARRGVKVHYLGSAYSDRAHDRCDDYVRSLQASHMDGNGWSDIGYSFVVCTHGYVYEGRGLRRRNSANGNTSLNEQDYAVCALVGSSGLTRPTDAQLHGIRDAIEYCRREGPAGTWIGGHRDGYATACPGDVLYAWVKRGAPRPSSTPAPQEDDMQLNDQIDLGDWVPGRWPGDKGLADGKLSVNTAIGSGYAHARRAAENSEATLALVKSQGAAIGKLVDTVAQLAASMGDLDPAAIIAELTSALESIDIRIDVPDAPAAT